MSGSLESEVPGMATGSLIISGSTRVVGRLAGRRASVGAVRCRGTAEERESKLGRSREMPGVCSSKESQVMPANMRRLVTLAQSSQGRWRAPRGRGRAVAQGRPRTVWRNVSEVEPLARAKTIEPTLRMKR